MIWRSLKGFNHTFTANCRHRVVYFLFYYSLSVLLVSIFASNILLLIYVYLLLKKGVNAILFPFLLQIVDIALGVVFFSFSVFYRFYLSIDQLLISFYLFWGDWCAIKEVYDGLYYHFKLSTSPQYSCFYCIVFYRFSLPLSLFSIYYLLICVWLVCKKGHCYVFFL